MKKILILAFCTVLCGFANVAYSAQDFSFDLDAAINEADGQSGTKGSETSTNPNASSSKAIYPSVDAQSYLNATNTDYYDPALIESLIDKYKNGNYVGCIQEAQSKIHQDNPNPVAMYYMALSYTKIGDVKAALDIYDAILRLKPGETLTECATRGRDCLIGGSACPNIGVEGVDIDAQVQEYKNSSLFLNDNTTDIQQILSEEEIATLPDSQINEKLYSTASVSLKHGHKVSSQSDAEKKTPDLTATKVEENSTPSNDEVAQAIKTLQNAGITVNLQPNAFAAGQNLNPEMAQMSMLLGNNNNQNHSLDMLPYMLMQNQNNPNQYNPQMMQAMMMNYMMPSLDFSSDNNNR